MHRRVAFPSLTFYANRTGQSSFSAVISPHERCCLERKSPLLCLFCHQVAARNKNWFLPCGGGFFGGRGVPKAKGLFLVGTAPCRVESLWKKTFKASSPDPRCRLLQIHKLFLFHQCCVLPATFLYLQVSVAHKMAHLKQKPYSEQDLTKDELACTYSALILADDDIAVTEEKIKTILKAANVEVRAGCLSMTSMEHKVASSL